MLDLLQDVTTKGLDGFYSHINPEKALADLNADIARKYIEGFSHSIWDLLHHMNTWQDVAIASVIGKEIDWNSITKEQNWPSEETKKKDEDFDKLLTRFFEGLKEIKKLIKITDPFIPISSWEDNPVLQAFMVAITHNSYHLGQILVLKQSFQVIEKGK